MFPKNFKPSGRYNLIRLGRNNDGGYLVEKKSLDKAKGLLSYGLGLDWSFEKDFFDKKISKVHVYDYFVKKSGIKKYSFSVLKDLLKFKNYFDKNFFNNLIEKYKLYFNYKKFFVSEVKHFRNSVGRGPNLISVDNTLKLFRDFPILVKIDIEGSEYRILNDLIKNQEKFCGLIIEFHDVDLHKQTISNFIKNFNLNLTHIHGQNVGDKSFLDKHGNPTQIEMTFSKSEVENKDEPQIPHALDQPSDQRYKETQIFFEEL
tara:strand:- start:353 stop:1132 length:780 start_codon:yes stop_codon:yes gene_type:complete